MPVNKMGPENFVNGPNAADVSDPTSGQEQTPSKEREIHDIASGSIIAFDNTLSKSELKAKMVDILDRGVTADRLGLDVKDGIHYEWVPNNAVEKNRMRTLGFEVLSRNRHLSSGNPLHEGGSDEIIVGDVIAMGCSRARKDVLDEIRKERFIAMHGKAGSNTQAEEGEYRDKARDLEPAGIGHFIESNTTSVTGTELAATIRGDKS